MFAVPANTVALPVPLKTAHPVRIALSTARDRPRWAHLLRYDPDQRYSALVERNAEYEIWLLSWLPGQHTDLHDHSGVTGAFTVVSGMLSERVIKQGADWSTVDMRHPLRAGQSRVFGPRYVHQVSNTGVDPAVSIHVYRPARPPMTGYELDPITGLHRNA